MESAVCLDVPCHVSLGDGGKLGRCDVCSVVSQPAVATHDTTRVGVGVDVVEPIDWMY